jgi:hypothetical protein
LMAEQTVFGLRQEFCGWGDGGGMFLDSKVGAFMGA